jgi:nitrogen fixation-related uncharacterized protein
VNTGRWDAWIAMLKQSDATLVQLATMAAAAVLIWEMLRQVPDRWRERARSLYLVGLLILFAYLIGGQMDTTAYTVGVAIVMFVVGGAAAIWWAALRTAKTYDENSTVKKQETK